ncbi:hypothetical protein AJ79_06096 [Helicocarpus griseus UAMH5409]|uniref:Uncharacterized protein n=1 Tax=Helicocarpus griseus UAMH5409 TaxID=1447875 RepID=A0A2B7XG22_9EURO|nr:hypothetical protein AJ79_06096 [Helicocarpus griseus UAMH5409]
MEPAVTQTPNNASHEPIIETIGVTQSLEKSNTAVRHVQTTINYYKDPEDGSPPIPAVIGKPETFAPSIEPVPVTITDITGSEDNFTLDGNGFRLVNHESKLKTLEDFPDDLVKEVYYPETCKLIKEITGASAATVFDHFVRHPASPLNLGPVRLAHIDQHYAAPTNRVRHHFPAEHPYLLQCRHQIINLWRPIKPIYRDPLAVADARTVPDEDLVAVPLIYPDRKGGEWGTFSVKRGEEGRHKWYYKYGQRPEQAMVFKCFDSKVDGRARRSPHCAFVGPGTEGLAVRESVEVRVLVFYFDEGLSRGLAQ